MNSYISLVLLLLLATPSSSLAVRSCVASPYGRTLPLEAIAAVAVYLSSDEAAGVHGTSLDVDGGPQHRCGVQRLEGQPVGLPLGGR